MEIAGGSEADGGMAAPSGGGCVLSSDPWGPL